jgi:murein DD-endopeptidase MepM/ murein hydrolase activator NlpD
MHELIAPASTPVLAMLSGTVHLVQAISGYGLTVLLEHGRGWQTVYAPAER